MKPFLEKRRANGDERPTHTCMYGPLKGKFIIPIGDHDKFVRLHTRLAITHPEVCCFIELPGKYSLARVDVDLRYSLKSGKSRMYAREHVALVARAFRESFGSMISADLSAYVFERDKPSVSKAGTVNDGFHIMFPHVIQTREFFTHARKNACKIISQSSIRFNTLNSVDQMIDEASVAGTGWFVYGSGKPFKQPYRLSTIITVEETKAIPHNQELQAFSDLTNMLRVRRLEADVVEARVKLPTPKPRDNANLSTVEFSEFTTIQQLVCLLSAKRADDYMKWIKVGLCLHFICSRTNKKYSKVFLALWKRFSKSSTKYIKGRCEECWRGMRRTNQGLGEGTLRMWAKLDSPENYVMMKTSTPPANAFFDECII